MIGKEVKQQITWTWTAQRRTTAMFLFYMKGSQQKLCYHLIWNGEITKKSELCTGWKLCLRCSWEDKDPVTEGCLDHVQNAARIRPQTREKKTSWKTASFLQRTKLKI